MQPSGESRKVGEVNRAGTQPGAEKGKLHPLWFSGREDTRGLVLFRGFSNLRSPGEMLSIILGLGQPQALPRLYWEESSPDLCVLE